MNTILDPKRHHHGARASIVLIAVTVMAGTVGCGGGGGVEYNLAISSTAGGSVTTPGEGTFAYEEGEAVNLVADADEGYQFVSWTGDVDDIVDVAEASTTITMKDDYSITATFAVKQYSLVIQSTEGGSVTDPGEEAFTYDEGEVVNLAATPDEYCDFVNWTGDVSTIADVEDATTTITMNDNYSITANFAVHYVLMIDSTDGGQVTTPGKGSFTYDPGVVVDLVAEAKEGYQFVNWTGDVSTIADVNAASTDITINGHCTITASFAKEIQDWHDLDAIRDNLSGSYILMNDLDSTTAGYTKLASRTANRGSGWQPILWYAGSLDGQGYEIRDLFINRPGNWGVGLFGYVNVSGVVEDIDMVNTTVTGWYAVGGLVGWSHGTVSNSYCSGSVTGEWAVGGLVGRNEWGGDVNSSHSKGSVKGNTHVGGLVGVNRGLGAVTNSYSAGRVSGDEYIGGLVGSNGDSGAVSNCYSTGRATGSTHVGGLVGHNFLSGEGTVSNSFWDTETSGQSTSDGGTGKTTAEMKNIGTFSGEGWNIIAVADADTRNASYIWNIVDGQSYPFLSWEP